MGQTEDTIVLIKEIECLLGKLGARDKDSDGTYIHGQGKLTEVEDKLPNELVRKLRWIITIRNKLIHESGFQVEDFSDYKNECMESIKELKALSSSSFSRNKESYATIEETPQEKETIFPGIISLWVILVVIWWIFFSGMSNAEKENIIIENNNQILTINNSIKHKSLELEELKENQGFLRSVFNDTDKVNELEDEIELLDNNKSNLEKTNTDLQTELNED
jgi:hypothetical protein